MVSTKQSNCQALMSERVPLCPIECQGLPDWRRDLRGSNPIATNNIIEVRIIEFVFVGVRDSNI